MSVFMNAKSGIITIELNLKDAKTLLEFLGYFPYMGWGLDGAFEWGEEFYEVLKSCAEDLEKGEVQFSELEQLYGRVLYTLWMVDKGKEFGETTMDDFYDFAGIPPETRTDFGSSALLRKTLLYLWEFDVEGLVICPDGHVFVSSGGFSRGCPECGSIIRKVKKDWIWEAK